MFGKLIIRKPTGDVALEYPVNQEFMYVGRSKDCDIRIENSTIAEKQFLLSSKGDRKVEIQNLSKHPPTKVNQKSISFQVDHELNEQDVISFANREFVWSYVVNESLNTNEGGASTILASSNKRPRKSEPVISHRKVAIVAPHQSNADEIGPPRKRCKTSYQTNVTCTPLHQGSTSLCNPPSSSFAQRKLYDRLLKKKKKMTPRNRKGMFGSKSSTSNVSPWVNQSAVNCEEPQLGMLTPELPFDRYCPKTSFNQSITPNTFYKRNSNTVEPLMSRSFAFSEDNQLQNYDERAQLFTRRTDVYHTSGKPERVSTPFPKKKLSSSFHSHKTPRSRATSGFYFPTINEDGQHQNEPGKIGRLLTSRKALLPTPDEGYVGRGMTPASYFSPAPTGTPRMMRADSPSLALNVRSGRRGQPSQTFATPNGVMPMDRNDGSMEYYGWMTQGPSNSFAMSSRQMQSPRTEIGETSGSTMFSTSEFNFTRSPMDYSYSNGRFLYDSPYSPSQSTQDYPLTPRSNRVAFLKKHNSLSSRQTHVSPKKLNSFSSGERREPTQPSSDGGVNALGEHPVRRRSQRNSSKAQKDTLNNSKVSENVNADSQKDKKPSLNVSIKSKRRTPQNKTRSSNKSKGAEEEEELAISVLSTRTGLKRASLSRRGTSKFSNHNADSQNDEELALNVPAKSKKHTPQNKTRSLNASKGAEGNEEFEISVLSNSQTSLKRASLSRQGTPKLSNHNADSQKDEELTLNVSAKSMKRTPQKRKSLNASEGVEEKEEEYVIGVSNSQTSLKRASMSRQGTPKSILKSPINDASPYQGTSSIADISAIKRASINTHVSFSTPTPVRRRKTSKTTSTPFPNSKILMSEDKHESTLPTDLEPSESQVSYMSSDSPDYDRASDDEITVPNNISNQLTEVSNSLRSNSTFKKRKSKRVSFVAVKTSLRRKSSGLGKRSSIDAVPTTVTSDKNVSRDSLKNTSSRKGSPNSLNLKLELAETIVNQQPELSDSMLATPLQTLSNTTVKVASRQSSRSTINFSTGDAVEHKIKQERISPDHANLSSSSAILTASPTMKRMTNAIAIVKDEVATPTNTSLKVNFRSRRTASLKHSVVTTPLSSKKKAHSRSLNLSPSSQATSPTTRLHLRDNSGVSKLKRKLTDEFKSTSPKIDTPSSPKKRTSSRLQHSSLDKLTAPSFSEAPLIIVTESTPLNSPVASGSMTPPLTISPTIVLRASRKEGLDKIVPSGSITPTSSFRQSSVSSSAVAFRRKLKTAVTPPRVPVKKLNLDPGKLDKKKMAALLMCHKKKSPQKPIEKPTIRKSIGVVSTRIRRLSKTSIKLRASLPQNFRVKISKMPSSVDKTITKFTDDSKEQTSPGDDWLNALDLSRKSETIVQQRKPSRRLRSSRKDLNASQASSKASSSCVDNVVFQSPLIENNARVSGISGFAEGVSSVQKLLVPSPMAPSKETMSYVFNSPLSESSRRLRSSRKDSNTSHASSKTSSPCVDNVIFRSPLVENNVRVSGIAELSKGESSIERVLVPSPTTSSEEPMSRVFTTSPVVAYTDSTGKKKSFRASSTSGINCRGIRELIPAEEIDYTGVRNLFEESLPPSSILPSPPKPVSATKLKEIGESIRKLSQDVKETKVQRTTRQTVGSPRKTRSARVCSVQKEKIAPKPKKSKFLKTPKKSASLIREGSPLKVTPASPSASPKQSRKGALTTLELEATNAPNHSSDSRTKRKSTPAKPKKVSITSTRTTRRGATSKQVVSVQNQSSNNRSNVKRKFTPAQPKEVGISTRATRKGVESKLKIEVKSRESHSTDKESQSKGKLTTAKVKQVSVTSTKTTKRGTKPKLEPKVKRARNQRTSGKFETKRKSTPIKPKKDGVISARKTRRGVEPKPEVKSAKSHSMDEESQTKESTTPNVKKVGTKTTTASSSTRAKKRDATSKLESEGTNNRKQRKSGESQPKRKSTPVKPKMVAAISPRTTRTGAKSKREPMGGKKSCTEEEFQAKKKSTPAKTKSTSRTTSRGAAAELELAPSSAPKPKSTRTLGKNKVAKLSVGNKSRKTTAGKKSPPKTIGKMTLKSSQSKPSKAAVAQGKKSAASARRK